MSWRLFELPWLPPVPADFRRRCRALLAMEDRAGPAVASLAGYALGTDDLIALGKAIGKLRAAGRSLEPLVPVRLGILANGTTQLWTSTLPASAARHGIALSTVVAEYDQFLQAAIDPDSAVNRAQPDAVLLALDYRAFNWDTAALGRPGASAQAFASVQEQFRAIRDGIAACGSATVIWQTLACSPEPLLGHLDRQIQGAVRRTMDDMNRWIAAECAGRGDCLLDVAAVAEQVGTTEWFDPLQWNLHKLPFAPRLAPLYAEHVSRLLGALRGRSRKCLVLDLDDTLWGGVIGDDGLQGIRIGQGSGEGEAFIDVQRYALALRGRGVILAVVTKNDEANARAPFREHPDMLLREEHFAAFAANWIDKATNLEGIARDLNLGLDALVLLDDNPAERAQVRAALPAVAVPELPADPSYYVRSLAAAGYFESTAFVPEDLLRAEQYGANAGRASARAASRDLGEFLLSLEMVAIIGPFDAIGRPRIAQLINKSNQYNLTTRRYTETEVAALEGDPSIYTLQVRLRDRFGDNGMISVVICRADGAIWDIDTWLMSCRVLGRRVEFLVLDEVVQAARAMGVTGLRGRFIATGKNDLVREHYAKLGFTRTGADAEDTVWTLALAGYGPPDLPFRVQRFGNHSQQLERHFATTR